MTPEFLIFPSRLLAGIHRNSPTRPDHDSQETLNYSHERVQADDRHFTGSHGADR
jgi:hypothetical protein